MELKAPRLALQNGQFFNAKEVDGMQRILKIAKYHSCYRNITSHRSLIPCEANTQASFFKRNWRILISCIHQADLIKK